MKTNTSGEAGSTLLVAVIVTLIVSAAIAVSIDTTMQAARLSQRTQRFEGAQAIGDAYLDWAFGQWRAKCATTSNLPLPSSSFNPLTTPSTSVLSSPANAVVTGYQVVGMSPAGIPDASPTITTAPAKASFQNLLDSSWFYLASATVTVPTINKLKPVTTTVNRVFEKHLSSPWEYAIFYNDTLEFHPSPSFTVNGMVKSNGAIYASPDAGAPLNFGNAVYYATSFSDGYAPGDFTWRAKSYATAGLPASAAGPGDPSDPDSFTAGLPPAQQSRADPFGISPANFNTTDTNPNNDGYHELLEKATPGFADPFNANGVDSRFYDNASVKVLIDVNNAVTILDASNNVAASTSALYKAVMPAISTNQDITDTRESAIVRLASVDVSQLKTTSIPGWNGVLYIADTSVGTAVGSGNITKRGIRIKNGATVPSGGLTVVANNPMYVQGDFNTSTTRQPSALVADAINVLSNSWADANSSAALSSRVASDTTVNAAFMSGITPTLTTGTTNANYSGGVENFPRFLEDWSNKTFTYNGSMVELFNSQQATGRWASASYNPPIRNWAFDVAFMTTPPPGTLYTITYIKGRWFAH